MIRKKSRLKIAQEQEKIAVKKTNEKIYELGEYTSHLYDELNAIQKIIDDIRNVPSDKQLEFKNMMKIRLNWRQHVEKIELDYETALVKNAGKGAAGVSAGVAVAVFGPTTAMGLATTFGIASTGTAISTLSGAAATNAALAWLGGGALVAGGGGKVVGTAIIALAGPVGWAIVGASLVNSGFLFWKGKNDYNRIADIFTFISKRNVRSFELSIVEINERINRIKVETEQLHSAIERIRTFGLDYNLLTEEKQYELGSYVNLMNSSTQLLVNLIKGLQPKYDETDLREYIVFSNRKIDDKMKPLIISLSNLLYKVSLDKKDKKPLWKTFKKNKEFLSSMEISKKDFELQILEIVIDVLEYKYSNENLSR